MFKDLVDEAWRPHDLSQLVQYLRMAPVLLCTSFDPQACPVCGNALEEVGTWRWDNKWLWPQTVAHYVENHFVRLPDEMADDLRSRNYTPPQTAECDYSKANAVFSALDELTSKFGPAYGAASQLTVEGAGLANSYDADRNRSGTERVNPP